MHAQNCDLVLQGLNRFQDRIFKGYLHGGTWKLLLGTVLTRGPSWLTLLWPKDHGFSTNHALIYFAGPGNCLTDPIIEPTWQVGAELDDVTKPLDAGNGIYFLVDTYRITNATHRGRVVK